MNRTNRVFGDLNLLRVFLTIWEVRSLTGAGLRLGLTQPAISHSLRRLRETFGDPLFVRGLSGMVPTELASRLHPPINEAFRIIQRAVQDSEHFDPATAQRVFRLSMSDISELYFLPTLMTQLALAAPSVQLEILQFLPATVEQSMRTGEVDLTIGYVPGLQRNVTSHRLFADSFVCLVRAGHPIASTPIDERSLGALEYIYASTNATGHQLTEQWLTKIGVARRIALRLNHFTLAPKVVQQTDLAVIFPESVARMINSDDDFALLPLPEGKPTIDIMVHTHVQFGGDLGIGWLRDVLCHLFGERVEPTSVPSFAALTGLRS